MANGRRDEEEPLATRVGRTVGGTARAAGEQVGSRLRSAGDVISAPFRAAGEGLAAAGRGAIDIASRFGEGFGQGITGAEPAAQEFIPATRFPTRATQGAPAPQIATPRPGVGAMTMSPAAGAAGARGMQGFVIDPGKILTRGPVARRDVAGQAQPNADVQPDRPAATPPPGAPERVADRTEAGTRDVSQATGDVARTTEEPALTGPELQPITTPRGEQLQRVGGEGVEAGIGREGEAEFSRQGQVISRGSSGIQHIPLPGSTGGFTGAPVSPTLGTFIPGADNPLFGARIQAAAQGNIQAVLESYLDPEGFARQQQLRELERAATARISLDQSFGDFLNAAATRNFAQRRLLASEQSQAQAGREAAQGQRQERLEMLRQAGQTGRARERAAEGRELVERRGELDLERGLALEEARGERRADEISQQAQLRRQETEEEREFQREQARGRAAGEAAEQRREEMQSRREEEQRLRREIITGELERAPGAAVEEVTGRAAETIRSLQEQVPPPGFPSDAQMFRKPDGTMGWAVRRGGQVIEVFEDGT